MKRKESGSPGFCCRKHAENHWQEFLEADFSFPAITGAPLAGTALRQRELLRQEGFKERVNGHLSGKVSRMEDEDKVEFPTRILRWCDSVCVYTCTIKYVCTCIHTHTYI